MRINAFSSVTQLCPTLFDSSTRPWSTLWTAAHQASKSITNSWSLLKLMSLESVIPPNHLIFCPPPTSSRLQSFPASGSFSVSQFFASGGQSIGVSASASVLPMNIQDWSPLGWSSWISCSSRDSQESSSTSQLKIINLSVLSFLYSPTLSHTYVTTGKTIALTRQTFVTKVMSLLFNMLSKWS